ncbi:MAG: hypothetical protein IT450_01470 [Phycisphaerales bacterium]|nr:hypothetical protein [Phycisphaerales bacterium]
MTNLRKPRIRRQFGLAVAAIVIGLITGCNGQTDLGVTLRDFVTDFARSALAAFLL